MRIVTWNINGVRTLSQYHPWKTLKTFDDILNYLEADIICFQELKSSRQSLLKQVALPPSFDSFFSFPTRKTGYSGVAVYTRRSTVVPLKAEEGLSGLVQSRPPLTIAERISPLESYSSDSTTDNGNKKLNHKDLDSEGRALVVDFSLFVLVNVYCPNDGAGAEERATFKTDYHRLLESRVKGLINEGREVMVVGDLNACAAVQDHCEGERMVMRGLADGLQGEEGFWGTEDRHRMKDWLVKEDGTDGCMVDIVRTFWPNREGMYTCWDTRISARATNYGTRIDYILITPNLQPWVKAADIQPEMQGSDHCPVFIHLHDEITQPDGTAVKLSDLLGAPLVEGAIPEPPRLAAKNWDEYKQNLLTSFFEKNSGDSSANKTDPQISSQTPAIASDTGSIIIAPPSIAIGMPPSLEHNGINLSQLAICDATTNSLRPAIKRRLSSETTTDVASKKPNLSQTPASQPQAISSIPKVVDQNFSEVYQEEDNSLLLSQSNESGLPSSSQSPSSSAGRSEKKNDSGVKQAWRDIFAPTPVPRCHVHREPAKELTVTKRGPNKGKKFFLCSRPVGPGYDKGRAEMPREHVNPQWRCDFFKWSSDVRKEMMRNGKV